MGVNFGMVYKNTNLELEELLGIETHFENPLSRPLCSGFDDVKRAARQIREAWGLGTAPIPKVLELLEEKGFKVVEFEELKDFDALSSFVGDIPVIALNEQMNKVRRRFSALHELGHLVLKFPEGLSKKREEQLCHAFASEMLIPEEVLLKALGERRKRLAIQELVETKKDYGISIAALVMRAEKGGIISRELARRFWELRDRDEALRLESPEAGYGDHEREERSNRFMHLIWKAAAEELISMSKAADLAQMSLSKFRKIFLPL